MAILIKGIEMPDSCFLCRFCRRQEYGEYVGEDTAWSCVASKKRITDGQDLIATFKHPDCPLAEVQDAQTEKKSLNGDVIDRQAAIDVAHDWYEGLICGSFKGLEKRLRALPSAQPDIIRCEDCKWYGRADKRRFYRGMDCLQKRIDTIVPDRDFCSKAERRTDEQTVSE